MSPDTVLDLTRQAMVIILLLSMPILLTALAVGLLVGMFQAATQINEMTLSFIPKLFAVVLAILLAGPWMLHLLVDFTTDLFHRIPGLIG
ncbi:MULTISPECIES: flagellar biosynthesis protein FliQ [Halothiobacillus]|jgi:flagellar biosynthetic protein FliQ|uniref:Flagellar biosynthetic protein FliQ n=1 Tax=Halothiobacillus neapolitanus (strain ATCC 23641 / DSM 15147 / CIP 104769 / NCIMB 8539 / c2) TaxID=555778 RepID=D0KYN8_HALNC|nr:MULTISPECIES: flagellar biosynthesis protein FliQ [Halothiobacillus]OZB57429.1 MAG: flagellar export apparatus protein FliQ [Halothiobacillus sp. 14-56-357]OZB75832.1 MAG: flagellar export apparatus protein FliQ [Halothiobacillus sp. 14-55-98]OZB78268.1 MAG: flagellar export apparatus protein FliQ [Halothiobacillus sp. 13-55-115]OZB81160.1 MAG: flagellar export apparatus protein FliQ [Halothiobacillus sp. 13-55-253]ACX95561.1 flagellar biosynthetic protein FliQ [Halothiobacillus neapolitanu